MKNYVHIASVIVGNHLQKIKTFCRYGHFQSREYVVDREKRIAYLVNSKVACTSIKASICGADKDDDSVHSIVGDGKWFRRDKLRPDEQDYFKFTFVRDPFPRLVSCYESKYHNDVTFYKKKELDFDRYLFGYIKKDEGFETFIRKIVRIPGGLLDRHFLIQSDWIRDKSGKLLVDYVGRCESLDAEYKLLQEKYGLGELPHFNTTGTAKKNWMDAYTPETARLVYRKYRKDIEEFGYQDTYKKLMRYLKEKEKKA